MYKSIYKPIDGRPLTITIPMLLEWKNMSPQRVDDETGSRIKQANIHRICKGQTKNPGRDVVEGIAKFFGLSFLEIYDTDFVREYIANNGCVARQGLAANGVAEAPSHYQEARSIFSQIDDDVAISMIKEYITRLHPQKRVQIARDALAGLPDEF